VKWRAKSAKIACRPQVTFPTNRGRSGERQDAKHTSHSAGQQGLSVLLAEAEVVAPEAFGRGVGRCDGRGGEEADPAGDRAGAAPEAVGGPGDRIALLADTPAAAALNSSWYALGVMGDPLGRRLYHLSRAPTIRGEGHP
jgi:hypothetical protein